MNEITLYWIWLQLCLGSGARTDEIIAYFENPKDIYFAGKRERLNSQTFTDLQLKKLSPDKLKDAYKVIEECEKIGCGIITPDSPKYPKSLYCMTNYPLVLYTMGNIECLKNKIAISVVGTRKASDSGLDIAGKLSASLCRAGVVIVSGGAFGIDSAAHMGALSVNGSTVAVLGCGFNAKYKDGAEVIRQDIMENGAIISEYHPSVEARGMNFPIRNRIIAALGLGTVVVEAAAKSGSLITASLAAEFGKDIFAVPGNAANLIQLGTIGLIRDGATPVFSSIDVLGQYAMSHSEYIDWDSVESDLLYQNHEKIDFSKVKYTVTRVLQSNTDNISHIKKCNKEKTSNDIENHSQEKRENNVKKRQPDTTAFTPEEQAVYDVFGERPVSTDELKEKTQLPMPKILVALTKLEISGIIKSQPGNIYVKI